MKKTALLAGGTGLVGSHLLALLVESQAFDEIKVIQRKEGDIQNKDVSAIIVDYNCLSDFREQLSADVIFCCLGTTMKKAGSKDQFYKVDYTYPYELAKLSSENGSRQFNIITASGADSGSYFYYNRVKGEIENALRGMMFQNLNIFRPSLLLGQRNEQRFGEQIGAAVAKLVNPLLQGGMKKYRAIQAETVAWAMLQTSLEKLDGVNVYESDAIQVKGEN